MKPEEVALNVIGLPSRPPCGGRGLKQLKKVIINLESLSPPVRGVAAHTLLQHFNHNLLPTI